MKKNKVRFRFDDKDQCYISKALMSDFLFEEEGFRRGYLCWEKVMLVDRIPSLGEMVVFGESYGHVTEIQTNFHSRARGIITISLVPTFQPFSNPVVLIDFSAPEEDREKYGVANNEGTAENMVSMYLPHLPRVGDLVEVDSGHYTVIVRNVMVPDVNFGVRKTMLYCERVEQRSL